MLDFHILGPSSAFDLQTSRVTLLCIVNSNDDLFSTETSVLNGSFEAETCVGSGNKNRFSSEAFRRFGDSAPFLKQERKWIRPHFSEEKWSLNALGIWQREEAPSICCCINRGC
jgi:hypothetical protein